MKPNTSRLVQTRAPSGVAFLTTRFSCMKVLPFARRCHPIIPCPPPARQPGNRLPAARRGRVKKFSKIFFVFALKKEVGALLWQNGNETCFRETELAFLTRLFTGYLQLYPTHTKLLLALQRPRGIARARSLLNDVFSFERNNTARDCFRPGRCSVFPFWRRSAVRLESLSLLRGRLGVRPDHAVSRKASEPQGGPRGQGPPRM